MAKRAAKSGKSGNRKTPRGRVRGATPGTTAGGEPGCPLTDLSQVRQWLWRGRTVPNPQILVCNDAPAADALARAVTPLGGRVTSVGETRKAPIADLPPGPFHYILCNGLPDTSISDESSGDLLDALVNRLHPDGGIGLSVPGGVACAGLSQLQELVARVASENASDPGDAEAARVDRIVALLAELPESNWFRGQAAAFGGADPTDLLAWIERSGPAWQVGDLYARLASHALHVAGWADPLRRLRRNPAMTAAPVSLKARMAALAELERDAMLELWWGDWTHHRLFLSPHPDVAATVDDGAYVPYLPGVGVGPASARQYDRLGDRFRRAQGASTALAVAGVSLTIPASAHLAAVMAHMDGQTDLETLWARAADDKDGDATADAVQMDTLPALTALRDGGILHLRHRDSVPLSLPDGPG